MRVFEQHVFIFKIQDNHNHLPDIMTVCGHPADLCLYLASDTPDNEWVACLDAGKHGAGVLTRFDLHIFLYSEKKQEPNTLGYMKGTEGLMA